MARPLPLDRLLFTIAGFRSSDVVLYYYTSAASWETRASPAQDPALRL